MQRKIRSLNRKKTTTVTKVNLHSSDHHSFHIGLSTTEAWNLLYEISILKWQEENKAEAPLLVDKTAVRKISLSDR